MSMEAVLGAARQGKPITFEDAEALISKEDAPTELLESAGAIRDKHVGKELRFYYPFPRFPSVSVTGKTCALCCKHCGGYYLRAMANVDTPTKLKDFCTRLEAEGGTGLLVSGGSNAIGRVPFDRFYGALRWVKENTGLIVNVHTGLLNPHQAGEIASTGIDIASVDVVGSDETIKRVYGLKATTEDYWDTLSVLKEAGVPYVVPHICVGLDFGEIRGEVKALEMAQRLNPEVVVILGLMPTHGTAMEAVEPPSANVMARAIALARFMCPSSSVALGCMRPRTNKVGIEAMAIRAGADRLVLPSRKTIEMARLNSFSISHLDGCCSIPKSLEHSALRRVGS